LRCANLRDLWTMSFWRQEVVQPALDRDVEQAIAEQQAILQQNARSAGAHFALGILTYYKGDRGTAAKYFRQAIELDPNYAAPRVSLGRMLALDGDHAAAWEHARAAERLGDRSLLDLLERYLSTRHPASPEMS
jgi:tetratricopeptide (TPR) repeat protein